MSERDLLRLDYINSLPQPFTAVFCGGGFWPVHDIDAQTGLVRCDIVGKLEVFHIGEILQFVDESGVRHDTDEFYSDFVPEREPAVKDRLTAEQRAEQEDA